MNNLELAAIGNCQVSALLDGQGRMVWCCLPRPDANPAFCSLLEPTHNDGLGLYEIELMDFERAEQEYIRNTPIVQTTLYDTKGNAIRITDFAPRFTLYGRTYHPVMLIRTVTPLNGWPRIRVRIRPAGDYGRAAATVTHGSNHIRYVHPEMVVRLTTDVPLTAIMEEQPFVLTRPHHLVLGNDESIPHATEEIARDHFGQTRSYWEAWVRGLAIPFDWQEAVIRAAITLKLCTFEDTGAVIAAMTTSLPEAANSGRNWDYRFCWLRDSYFVVKALNSLGATRTMEAYLEYILNVSFENGGDLQPVYSITGQADLTERTVDSLAGYRGMGPVRVGNQAYEQVQNDVYGAVILSATQFFFDHRLSRPGNEANSAAPGNSRGARRRTPRSAGRRHLGVPRSAKASTRSRASCAGPPATDSPRSLRRSDNAERSSYWRDHADRIHAGYLRGSLGRGTAVLHREPSADRNSMPACC